MGTTYRDINYDKGYDSWLQTPIVKQERSDAFIDHLMGPVLDDLLDELEKDDPFCEDCDEPLDFDTADLFTCEDGGRKGLSTATFYVRCSHPECRAPRNLYWSWEPDFDDGGY